MTTFTRRIITALAGPAIAAGVIGGGIAVGSAAQAAAQPATATCVTAATKGPVTAMMNPLTRAAQVEAIEPQRPNQPPANSCVSR